MRKVFLVFITLFVLIGLSFADELLVDKKAGIDTSEHRKVETEPSSLIDKETGINLSEYEKEPAENTSLPDTLEDAEKRGWTTEQPTRDIFDEITKEHDRQQLIKAIKQIIAIIILLGIIFLIIVGINYLRKKRYIKKLSKKLNQGQKIIVAIIVPAILFVITVGIASKISSSHCDRFAKRICKSEPFNMVDTWYIWVFFLLIIGFFEYKLFSNYED